MRTIEEIRAIVEHFGPAHQIDKAIEECGELIAVLLQHRQLRRTVGDVINEVADVAIMVEQLRFIFGAEAVDEAVERKRRRLMERIAGMGK